ncbi:MAG: TIGR03618 family F420-dependent PPOX class oxidoreductase [Proteobacteria bacterium]|nr:TIGR03618 family F420-dependent PPOX class oxidoreductase [Pseudomonadota bacterium]
MERFSRTEALAFMAEGAPTGHLATTRENGHPHVAPVWFIIDGDHVVFNTASSSVKGRNLAREGRAAITVDDPHPPFAYVVAEGPVTISENPEDLITTATKIGGRYMGQDKAASYGDRNGVPGEYVIRMRCDRISGGRNVSG